jgi:hypothetical protein
MAHFAHTLTFLTLLPLTGCAPAEQPRTPVTQSPLTVNNAGPILQGAEPDRALLAKLSESKLTLAQGLEQAEARGAAPVSAKFELESGHLSLSVYTARSGLAVDAEHNVLAELSGDPSLGTWQPHEDVFADTAHIARAAYHLTLVQRSGLSLRDVLTRAAARQEGQIYSVTPAAQNRTLVFHVLVATADGGQVALDVEGG